MERRAITIGELERINKLFKPLFKFGNFVFKYIHKGLGVWLIQSLYDKWLIATKKDVPSWWWEKI